MTKGILIIIGFLIVCIAICIIDRQRRYTLYNYIKQSFFSFLLFSTTIVVFIPASIVISNQDDFRISSYVVVGICLLCSLLFTLAIIGIWAVLVLIRLDCSKVCSVASSILWGISLAAYIQCNFANPKLAELDGRIIDWSQFTGYSIINSIVWIVCIAVAIYIVLIDNVVMTKIMRGSSYILSLMQIISLVILISMNRNVSSANVALTKNDEFSVGSEQNTIIFVLDSLGAREFDLYLDSNIESSSYFDGFTYFDNVVSGGSYTSVGLPTLMTGMEYDPTHMSYDEWLDEAWKEASLYGDLCDYGYDVRIYTDGRYITNANSDILKNCISVGTSYEITNYSSFVRKLYKLVGYNILPTNLKKMCWMYTDEITGLISAQKVDFTEDEELGREMEDIGYYKNDDNIFHQDYIDHGGLQIKYDKAFRLYHMFGIHAPYTLTSDGFQSVSDETSLEEQMNGSLGIVLKYINNLQQLDLYNDSFIIITADHGNAGHIDGIQQNPALLVKRPKEHHELVIDSSPTSSKYIYNTISQQIFGSDYISGATIYDMSDLHNLNRFHTAIRESSLECFPDIPEDWYFNRFSVSKFAKSADGIELLNTDELNYIECSRGDEINLNCGNNQQGIYFFNDESIFNDEIFLNLKIKNYDSDDIVITMDCTNVTDIIQDIRVYVHGVRILDSSINAIRENEKIAIRIDNDKIGDDGVIHMRFVLKNARSIEADNQKILASMSVKNIYVE